MRIVSYNILDGGEGRADPLAEVIEAQKPDLVGLVESDDLSVIERLARRFQMDFIQAVGNKGRASTLLSKWPILSSVNHAAILPALMRSFLETTVRTPDGAEVTCGILHLHAGALDRDEQKRESEIAAILHIVQKWNGPQILMGDFNSNSPSQRIEIARCKPSTQRAFEANGRQIPRRVMQKLFDAGWLDTMDQQSATATTFTTHHPGQRVDFILARNINRSQIKTAWVETDRLATYASDHYPVCSDIEPAARIE